MTLTPLRATPTPSTGDYDDDLSATTPTPSTDSETHFSSTSRPGLQISVLLTTLEFKQPNTPPLSPPFKNP
ncbi:unnamed protein product [Brassica napus]|uniref:(rape) hypothetical protein n=1 Tax=Brassica napus TaxID=3708 RepID=A0A816RE08_BRANA|nr:unnamed protein product [Brassica napus]